MIEPERYAMSPAQTLAHVASRKSTPGDHLYWAHLRRRLLALDHRLEPTTDPAAFGDAAVTHRLLSSDERAVGCAIRGEKNEPRAVLIRLHGYTPGPMDPDPAPTIDGAVEIEARVRGFPGSVLYDPELAGHPTGWITHRIEDVDRWALTGAVLDAAGFVRAARREWPGTEVYLRGESFGGGLAVLATSLLNHKAPDRLVIGLPSLGDWRWRLRHECHGGSGEEVAQHILRNRIHEKSIVRSLLMMDAAIHAPRVLSPTLCKLAACDEVVPAPAAAGVYNNLGADPGMKARFVTPYGHFDGGIVNARRHAEFERAARVFLDPAIGPAPALARAMQQADS